MRQSIFNQRHANQVLFRGFHTFFDSQRNFARLPRAKADVTRLVADDHERGERKILSALNNLGHAIDRNNLILQIESLCGDSLFRLPHLFFCALASFRGLGLDFLGFAAASSSALVAGDAAASASASRASSLLSPAARAASVKALTRP